MRPIPSIATEIHPALTNFADEVCATVARLFVYVGVLALFGILGLHAWDKLRIDLAADPAPQPSWSVADRSYPAFALSPPDFADKSDKSDTYVIFRHPGGGRKDVLRWSAPGDRPAAELEIYRPGSEYPAVGGGARRPRHPHDFARRRARSRRRDREQVRQRGPAPAGRRQGGRGFLPRLPQADRRSRLADFRLVLPRRSACRPAAPTSTACSTA